MGASLDIPLGCLRPLRGELCAWLLLRNCKCALELNVPLVLFRGETDVDEAGTLGLWEDLFSDWGGPTDFFSLQGDSGGGGGGDCFEPAVVFLRSGECALPFNVL